eukprot:tig00001493_g8978.t1
MWKPWARARRPARRRRRRRMLLRAGAEAARRRGRWGGGVVPAARDGGDGGREPRRQRARAGPEPEPEGDGARPPGRRGARPGHSRVASWLQKWSTEVEVFGCEDGPGAGGDDEREGPRPRPPASRRSPRAPRGPPPPASPPPPLARRLAPPRHRGAGPGDPIDAGARGPRGRGPRGGGAPPRLPRPPRHRRRPLRRRPRPRRLAIAPGPLRGRRRHAPASPRPGSLAPLPSPAAGQRRLSGPTASVAVVLAPAPRARSASPAAPGPRGVAFRSASPGPGWEAGAPAEDDLEEETLEEGLPAGLAEAARRMGPGRLQPQPGGRAKLYRRATRPRRLQDLLPPPAALGRRGPPLHAPAPAGRAARPPGALGRLISLEALRAPAPDPTPAGPAPASPSGDPLRGIAAVIGRRSSAPTPILAGPASGPLLDNWSGGLGLAGHPASTPALSLGLGRRTSLPLLEGHAQWGAETATAQGPSPGRIRPLRR